MQYGICDETEGKRSAEGAAEMAGGDGMRRAGPPPQLLSRGRREDGLERGRARGRRGHGWAIGGG
eukprot:scaffold135160_cov34-Tisochrysis_lutea.AAC.1